jgi:hypothetical protein
MAKSNAILNIIFGADTKQLDRALGGVAKKLRGTAENLNGLGQSLSLGLTAPIAAFAGLATKSFVDSAKAIAQVEAAVKSTGGAAGRSVDQLSTLAEGLQRVSLFDDDEILQNVTANLLTFTNVAGTEFDRAQQAVLDLSTRLGTDLTSATVQVGKALNDPIKGVTSLGRAGVQFTAQQKELIETLVESGDVAGAQAVILGELETQFGGAAAAAANADPYTQLANEIGNLAEEFGGIINDAIKPLLGFIREVVDEVKGWSDGTKTLALVIAGLLAAIGPTLIAVGAMIDAFVTIKGAMKLLTIEQLKLNAAALANPYVLLAAAMVGLGVAIFQMSKRATDAETKVAALRDKVNDLTDAEANLEKQKAISDQAEKVRKLAAEYEVLSKQRAQGDQFEQRIFNQRKQQVKDELANAQKTLEGYQKLATQKESDAYWSGVAKERLAELNGTRRASNQAVTEEADALAAVEQPAKNYVDTLNERLAAIDAEYKITGDLNDRVTAQAEAYKTAAIAAQLLGNETEALALKQEMLNRAVAPEMLTPINPNADTSGVTNTEGPIVSNATTEAINAQIDAMTGLGSAFDDTKQKGLDFAAAVEQAIEQAAESIVINLAAMAGQALSSGQGMKGAGRMILGTIADLAIRVGEIAVGVGITIKGIQKALANLNPAVALIAGVALIALGSYAKAELAKSAQGRSSSGGGGASLGVPAFAQGGLVTGPMLAMVGDNPSGKEAIIPFERMGEFMKMMGGGQGAQQVVVTGRISGRDLILSNERTRYDRTRTKG